MSRYIVYFGVLLFVFSCGDKIREEITERYEDGRKKTMMKFIGEGGTEQMIEKLVYSESGDTLQWENYSKDGLKHGSWIGPDNSGIFGSGIFGSGIFLDGKEDGKWTFYNKDEQVKWDWDVNFKDGKLDGRCIIYHNGQIKEEQNFKDGKLDGRWILYYNDGPILMDGNYKDEKEDGKWTFYNEDGQIWKETYYKDGKIIETKEY